MCTKDINVQLIYLLYPVISFHIKLNKFHVTRSILHCTNVNLDKVSFESRLL